MESLLRDGVSLIARRDMTFGYEIWIKEEFSLMTTHVVSSCAFCMDCTVWLGTVPVLTQNTYFISALLLKAAIHSCAGFSETNSSTVASVTDNELPINIQLEKISIASDPKIWSRCHQLLLLKQRWVACLAITIHVVARTPVEVTFSARSRQTNRSATRSD